MPKIAFIGAGSIVFARNLMGDILSYPELEGSTLALMDIDADRLDRTATAGEAMLEHNDVDATIETTTSSFDPCDRRVIDSPSSLSTHHRLVTSQEIYSGL